MKKFFYMAEGGRLQTMHFTSPEMVYSAIACYYNPSRKVLVIDAETNEASMFTRKLDENGNLISITEHLRGVTIDA